MSSPTLRRRRLGLEALEGRCVPAAPVFDTTFGTGGRVATDFQGPVADDVRDAVLQRDGKIVVVGPGKGSNARESDFALTRYLANGSVDTSFGKAGHVITTFPTATVVGTMTDDTAVAEAVALQGDGRILVAGTATYRFGLARYNVNGTLDTTFGNKGLVTTAFGVSAEAKDLVVQPDGKIVVVGAVRPELGQPTNRFALARYNRDGSLDTTFGQGGKFVSTATPGLFAVTANRLALQKNGQILVAGATWSSPAQHLDAALFRINNNGKLDVHFGTSGYVRANFAPNSNDTFTGLAVQADGKILVSGSTGIGTNADFVAARFTTYGGLDPTFGSKGQLVVNLGARDLAQNAVLQADGKLVVTGQTGTEAGEADFVSIRLNPNGAMDPAFGLNRKATTSFGVNDQANAVLVQPDGRIVVAGRTGHPTAGASLPDLAIARYDRFGKLDTTFGAAGKVRTGRTVSVANYATASVVQADGKVVVAGGTNPSGIGPDFALARYNANGSLDATFGVGGRVTTDVDGWDNVVSVGVQPDGKVVVVGAGAAGLSLVRYTANGALDTSFGTGGKMVSSLSMTATRAVVLSSGKIVVGGIAHGDGGIGLVRFHTNGSLDTTFGETGVVRMSPGASDVIQAMVVDALGRIVVGGNTSPAGSTYTDWFVARFTATGELDRTFGTDGRVVTDLGSEVDSLNALTLTAGGQIVAVGQGAVSNLRVGLALARYNDDGSLDTKFGVEGKVVSSLAAFSSGRSVMLRDNQIVVAGVINAPTEGLTSIVASYNLDGSLNKTFADNGVLSIAGLEDAVMVAFPSRGKLLVVGTGRGSGGLEEFALARWLIDER